MFSLTQDSDATTVWAPEDVRQTTEKVMNFWAGALSPYWAPFWAASGLGLGVWAAGRAFRQGEGLLQELPLAMRWPGFMPLWGQKDFTPETLDDVIAAPVAAVAEVAAKAEGVAAKAAEPVLDPVVETPVVPAVVEAIAEPVAVPAPVRDEPAKAEPVTVQAKPMAPKPLAKELAVAKDKPAEMPAPSAKMAKPAAKPKA